MHDAGHIAKRAAKGGVDAKALKEAIGLHTVEMARRYIEGLSTPREDKIDHIAAWLKINVQWLRDGEGPKHGGAVASLSPVEHELLDDLRHCTDSDKQTLRALAKALRGNPIEHELLDDLRHCTDSDKQTLRALAKALRAKIG